MASSHSFHAFAHGHADLLLTIDYNFYGTRLATGSADHRVKVWDRDATTGQWTLTDTWIAHDGEVTDVRWNGPYVGEHLGTIGEDGLLRIWMEDVREPVGSGRRFKRIFQQSTPTGVPYICLDFKNLGTETFLAVTTRDGYIAVWEPEDVDDLSAWRIMWAEHLVKTPSRTEETAFRLCWHKEKLPPWPAVLAGLDRRSLSLAVSVGTQVRVFRTDKDRKFYLAAALDGAKSLVRDVAWASGSMRGWDVLATASKDGHVRVYELHTPTSAIAADPGSTSLPLTPNRANTFASGTAQSTPGGQTSATATSTSTRPPRSGIIRSQLDFGKDGKRDEAAGGPGAVRQEAKMVAEVETHAAAPWRVTWSAMGDVLVSTGDDGTARLWKRSVTEGKWMEAAEIDAVGTGSG